MFKVSSLALLIFSLATSAFAQGPYHAYIDSMRSSNVTHYYVSMGAEGEYGSAEAQVPANKDDGNDANNKHLWQGYGIRNEMGVEFIKFVQFNVAHTALNIHSKKDARERLFGSRFDAGARFTFSAPLGNLSLGGGLITSRMDYVHQDATQDFYGSGYYQSVGYNYFTSSNISISTEAKRIRENLTRNAGSNNIDGFKLETTTVGMCFKIWL